MPPELLPLAVACLDSPRTRAYLHAFARRGLAPARAVLLAGGGLPPGLVEESARHNYAEDYFDPTLAPEAMLARAGTRILRSSSPDINHPETVAALQDLDCPQILFTGGGIVAGDTLRAIRGRLVHIHPGALPDFRGSTCFYYSLLENGSLGASAFFMEEKIDAGALILVRRYLPNIRVTPDQALFMDHVLDPWLRSLLLGELLDLLRQGRPWPERPQPPARRQACFVAHPVIRSLATRRLNARFDPHRPQGLRPAHP